MRRRAFLLSVLAAMVPQQSNAQCQTIDLGVPNIPQQTPVWCWAAVAQQIIVWQQGQSPNQCALVAMANNAPSQFCCTGNPQCHVTGNLQQIQWLIHQFGGKLSSIHPPAGPDVLYATLANHRPVIMAVQSSPFSGHVVVLRGISCYGPQVVLHINDPMSYFTQPIPFQNVIQFWSAAIVVS